MKVLKFGGSSVGSPDRIQQVKDIILDKQKQTPDLAVVFSAFQGVTDQLIAAGRLAASGDAGYQDNFAQLQQRHIDAVTSLLHVKEQTAVIAELKVLLNELEDVLQGIHLVKELSPRSLDLVVGFGERMSAYIISEYFKAQGVKAGYLDARKVIVTDDNYGNARVDFTASYENIKKHFTGISGVTVITGFVGSTKANVSTTLGRGGSDYTASLFAAALDAEEVEIWTDVDGVLTADPRKVKKAFSVPELSYEEAMELSHFGAKVIYPPTIQPTLRKKIPLRIKNTFNPQFEGTLISEHKGKLGVGLIKGISSIDQITLLRLQGAGMVGVSGVSMRLFSALAQSNINIILITQASSEHTICLAVSPEDAEKAKGSIETEFQYEMSIGAVDEVDIQTDLSIVAIVGSNMPQSSGVSGRLFHALGVNGINVIAVAQGSSELNISVVIRQSDLIKALNSVHESFFLSDTKTLNVFVVGLGLIGKTLIKQIANQFESLKSDKKVEVKVIGVANSRKMYFQEGGLDLATWEAELDANGQPSDLAGFVQQMKELNLRNSIFVDNTASEAPAELYKEVLKQSISIVTPNKIASSSDYETYAELKEIASRKGVKFLYETNVGAGLPVISTLNDLIASGDTILKIEAVLSGSLSYLFNTVGPDKTFSEAVQDAVEKGYAEPDPRIDLSGKDVARKALILARESGLKLEFDQVDAENLVPLALQSIEDIPSFFKELPAHDAAFEAKRQQAQDEGKVLRYIAQVDANSAKASLQAVDANHPFFSLSGADNIVSFTTERYHDRPLVVKGPGAGAEVTAAGVFADIIRIANR